MANCFSIYINKMVYNQNHVVIIIIIIITVDYKVNKGIGHDLTFFSPPRWRESGFHSSDTVIMER